MKKLVFATAMVAALSTNALATEMCNVTVCNKIKRVSLDLFSHMKDSMGETCFESLLPKSDAVRGKELSSESRWYQGSSINPTKRSVTYVKYVHTCKEM